MRRRAKNPARRMVAASDSAHNAKLAHIGAVCAGAAGIVRMAVASAAVDVNAGFAAVSRAPGHPSAGAAVEAAFGFHDAVKLRGPVRDLSLAVLMPFGVSSPRQLSPAASPPALSVRFPSRAATVSLSVNLPLIPLASSVMVPAEYLVLSRRFSIGSI